MFSKQFKKVLSLSAILALLISGASFHPSFSPSNQSAYAQNDHVEETIESGQYVRKDLYSNYMDAYGDLSKPQNEIFVEGENYSAVEGMNVEVVNNYEGLDGSAVITEETGSISWEIDIPEEGLYNVMLKYFPIEGKSSSIERELWINGELPFQGAATLTFPRTWTNELPEIEQDNRGNDLRPRQVEDPVWMEVDLEDSEGYYTEPYLFYFKKGKNTISFVSSREPLVIDYIKLYQVPSVPTYEELKATYEEEGYKEADRHHWLKSKEKTLI